MSRYSIIVPVYRSQATLDRCVKSVLNQQFEDFELILVDDGSPDECGLICDQYANVDCRVKVIHKANGGVSSARNAGIMAATSERIIFLDSDDFLLPEALVILDMAVNTHDADIFCYSYEILGVKDTQKCILEKQILQVNDMLEHLPDLKGALTVLCTIWNKVYKRATLVENKILFKEGMKIGEDFLFNANCFLHTDKIMLMEEALYCYDTTIPGSAVKRVYGDIAEYISYMRDGIKELMDKRFQGGGGEKAADYFKEFINTQWNNSLFSCLNSSMNFSEKSRYITEVIGKMPTEEIEYANAKGNLLSLYLKRYGKRKKIGSGFVRVQCFKSCVKKGIQKAKFELRRVLR